MNILNIISALLCWSSLLKWSSVSPRLWTCGPWVSLSTVLSSGRQVCILCSTINSKDQNVNFTYCWAREGKTILLSWCGSHPVRFYKCGSQLLPLFSWDSVLTLGEKLHCLSFVSSHSPPQCPFIDENILALHNKIRTKPVEFPEK